MINFLAKLLGHYKMPFMAKLLLNARRYPSYSMTYQDAINYLGRIHKDPHNSCICNNNNIDAAYDLHIIIPVYNQEKYLRECLDSVFSQETDFSFLVTCVNDGSTDSSLEILEEYAKYPNLQIVNQANMGISGARNAALKNIQGRYICFVDSDDRLAPMAIQSLMKAALETDSVIVEGSYRYFKDGKIISTFEDKKLENVKTLTVFPSSKVIRSDIFERICFPMDYWFEDTIMTLIVYPLCRKNNYKMSTISDVVYDYRRNDNGITLSSIANPKILDFTYINMQLLEDAKKLDLIDQEYYESFLSRQVLIDYHKIRTLRDSRVLYALFVITQKLRNDYFSQFKTQNKRLKMIETALDENSFKQYNVYCLMV